MKTFNINFLLTVLFIALSSSAFAQTNSTLENVLVSDEAAKELIQVNNVETSSIEISNWFAGAKQNSTVTNAKESTTVNRTTLMSKKEQYLKSGMSNKTLLIRSIMKKADSYINATV